jgi:DNA-directed RNA polymerase subunit RPC12/RpoP
MMANATTRCAHCDVPIVDPTTQVVHGGSTFCCANCSAAMEETGSGSDPKTLSHEDEFRCAHCGAAIVDESTMESRGNDAFCCTNCASAMAATSTSSAQSTV